MIKIDWGRHGFDTSVKANYDTGRERANSRKSMAQTVNANNIVPFARKAATVAA